MPRIERHRRGITRTVWLVGRWAIKVPSLRSYGEGLHGVLWSFSRGIQANLSEREWSRHSDARDPICRVRWSLLGGLANVYPRCEPVPVDDQHEATIPLPAREWLPLGDAKAENFGILDGQVLWIDYDVSYSGCPHDRGGVAAEKQQLAEDLKEQLVQTLTIGRVVHYTLTAHDAASINLRRADYRAFEAGHNHPHLPGQPPATGHVAHVGNHAEEGQVFPATVVRVFSPQTTCANLQVYLDGNDVYWATSRPEGEGPGHWVLPTRA